MGRRSALCPPIRREHIYPLTRMSFFAIIDRLMTSGTTHIHTRGGMPIMIQPIPRHSTKPAEPHYSRTTLAKWQRLKADHPELERTEMTASSATLVEHGATVTQQRALLILEGQVREVVRVLYEDRIAECAVRDLHPGEIAFLGGICAVSVPFIAECAVIIPQGPHVRYAPITADIAMKRLASRSTIRAEYDAQRALDAAVRAELLDGLKEETLQDMRARIEAQSAELARHAERLAAQAAEAERALAERERLREEVRMLELANAGLAEANVKLTAAADQHASNAKRLSYEILRLRGQSPRELANAVRRLKVQPSGARTRRATVAFDPQTPTRETEPPASGSAPIGGGSPDAREPTLVGLQKPEASTGS